MRANGTRLRAHALVVCLAAPAAYRVVRPQAPPRFCAGSGFRGLGLRKSMPGDEMRPKKTILCVDDNDQALAVRKFLLETRGYRVVAARSGDEAVERFREGGIDLVLGDVVMPGMDGNEMVRRMKEIAPEVPTILISGSIRAFEHASRADAFLPKGASTPVEMLERIRIMIARKRGPRKVLRPVFNPADSPSPVSQPVAS